MKAYCKTSVYEFGSSNFLFTMPSLSLSRILMFWRKSLKSLTLIIILFYNNCHLCHITKTKNIAVLHIQSADFKRQAHIRAEKFDLIIRLNAFADSQIEWSMVYWIGFLMIIGSLLLPVTFLMTNTLGVPVITFSTTSKLFFLYIYDC